MEERESYIKALENRIDFYKAVLDKVDNGVLLTDQDGIIFEYNRAVSVFEQKAGSEVIGKSIKDVYNIDDIKGSRFLRVINNRESVLNVTIPYEIKDDGSKIESLVRNYHPIYSKNGEFLGVSAISVKPELLSVQLEAVLKIKEREIKKNIISKDDENGIIGKSSQIRQTLKECERVAQSDTDMLIIGETGTGKELFVKRIQNLSCKKNLPLVSINCATIPENLLESILFGTQKGAFTDAKDTTGLFEVAGEGILFLDEMNSMNMQCQSKLLRVIQEKVIRKIGGKEEIPIKCRIIGTLNEEPYDLIKEGRFRKDLFYRMAAISLYIPRLSERSGDINLLTDYFISVNNKKYKRKIKTVTPELRRILNDHDWPGNVRELKNLIESIFILVDAEEEIIHVKHLPKYFLNQVSVGMKETATCSESINIQDYLANEERELIKEKLVYAQGNKSLAAKMLGISKQKLQYRMKILDL